MILNSRGQLCRQIVELLAGVGGEGGEEALTEVVHAGSGTCMGSLKEKVV